MNESANELDDLCAELEQQMEARPDGVDLETFVARFPQWESELRRYIGLRRGLAPYCAPLREAAGALYARR